MSTISLCIIPMPTDRAVELAARIADADDPDCEALLLADGPEVCDVLRSEVLHQADEIERLVGVIGDAAASLDGEHMVTCARWVNAHARCDCIIGRVRATLVKGGAP